MTDQHQQDILSTVNTSEEALALIGGLREKFGLVGIDITSEQVGTRFAQKALSCAMPEIPSDDLRKFVEEMSTPVGAEILRRQHQNLNNRLAQRVDRVLNEQVGEAIAALRPGWECTYYGAATARISGKTVEVIMDGPWDNPVDLHQWLTSLHGNSVEDVMEAAEDDVQFTDGVDLATVITGHRIKIKDTLDERPEAPEFIYVISTP